MNDSKQTDAAVWAGLTEGERSALRVIDNGEGLAVAGDVQALFEKKLIYAADTLSLLTPLGDAVLAAGTAADRQPDSGAAGGLSSAATKAIHATICYRVLSTKTASSMNCTQVSMVSFHTRPKSIRPDCGRFISRMNIRDTPNM